jgi:hypothetical protein
MTSASSFDEECYQLGMFLTNDKPLAIHARVFNEMRDHYVRSLGPYSRYFQQLLCSPYCLLYCLLMPARVCAQD